MQAMSVRVRIEFSTVTRGEKDIRRRDASLR